MTTIAIFPILQLPEKSLKIAIQSLTLEELIKFSLISKSTKRAAESLNLQADSFWIYINECVYIVVHAKLNRMSYRQDIPWNPVEVDLRTLLDHFQSVLHTDKFEYFIVCSDDYNWKSMHEALDGLDIPKTSLQHDSQSVWLHKLVNKFSSGSLEIIFPDFVWFRPMLSSYRQNLTVNAGITDILSVNCAHLKDTCAEDLDNLPRNSYKIQCARDIYRCDGRRATVVIDTLSSKMQVWISR